MFKDPVELHCPCCGDPLRRESERAVRDPEQDFAVLACGCYRYPVVAGVPILWQQSGPADIFDEVVSLIDAGDHSGALTAALARAGSIGGRSSPGLARRLFGRLFGDHAKTSFRFSGDLLEDLRGAKTRTYADYLYQRFANASLLAALPMLAAMSRYLAHHQRGPLTLLDLGCGIGHTSYLLKSLLPEARVIAADYDFGNLLLARRYFGEQIDFLCLNAEVPLPFESDQFSAVFCLDAFHYLRSKRALVKELDRVLQDDAIWLLPHLHNAEGTNPSAGIPLTADGYQRLFDGIPHSLLPEAGLLDSYRANGGADLRPTAPDIRAQADVLTLVASRRIEFLCQQTELDTWLAQRLWPLLDINPVYDVRRAGTELHLNMSWPNPHLEAECQQVKRWLPPSARLAANLIAAGEPPDRLGEPLSELLRQHVVVPLPAGYRRRA